MAKKKVAPTPHLERNAIHGVGLGFLIALHQLAHFDCGHTIGRISHTGPQDILNSTNPPRRAREWERNARFC